MAPDDEEEFWRERIRESGQGHRTPDTSEDETLDEAGSVGVGPADVSLISQAYIPGDLDLLREGADGEAVAPPVASDPDPVGPSEVSVVSDIYISPDFEQPSGRRLWVAAAGAAAAAAVVVGGVVLATGGGEEAQAPPPAEEAPAGVTASFSDGRTVSYDGPTAVTTGEGFTVNVCVQGADGAALAGTPIFATLGDPPSSANATHGSATTDGNGCAAIPLDVNWPAGRTVLWFSDGDEVVRGTSMDVEPR